MVGSDLDIRGGLIDYTAERWSAALSVLRGEDPRGVSFARAARAAGVSTNRLRSWIERSRQEWPEDDPSIWSIHRDFDEVGDFQAGRLEDAAWCHALGREEVTETETKDENGKVARTVVKTVVKSDTSVLLRLLGVRDKRYEPSAKVSLTSDVDMSRIFQRLTAERRLALAAAAAAESGDVIDLSPSSVSVGSGVSSIEGDASL